MRVRVSSRASLRRFFAELTSRTSERGGEAALARLRAKRAADGVLEIAERDQGRALGELRDEEADVVRVARDVYARVPGSAVRVRLLRLLRGAARSSIVLHVTIAEDHSHAGRALIDAPRALLRSLRIPTAEPGDRVGPDRYVHCFFDEEELLAEVAQAGLVVTERRGSTFVLVATDPGQVPVAEEADPFPTELARAAALVRAADRDRRSATPEQALGAMRDRGQETGRTRGPIGRARLRRAIGWVDAVAPGGASCYRRVLLESALDAGAARETVVFGLDVGRTGHVAFQDREERTFDVSFAIPGGAR